MNTSADDIIISQSEIMVTKQTDTTHFMMDPSERVGAMENHSTSESYDQTNSYATSESDKSLHLDMLVLENGLEETCSSYMNDIEADHFDLSTIQRGLLSLRASAVKLIGND